MSNVKDRGKGKMKRISSGIIAMLFAIVIGIFLNKFITSYFLFSNLQNEVRVTWQDEEYSCGKPSKISFSHSDESIIIDNPLCNYSADLHEVPTVSYSELARNPKNYDQKIVRVKGRYQMDFIHSDSWNRNFADSARLYMKSDSPSGERPLEYNSPWDFDITKKLRNFIELNSPETNSAEVSLIIEFLDVSDNPSVLENTNNNPLQMLILHIEEMKPFVVSNKTLSNLLKNVRSEPDALIRPKRSDEWNGAKGAVEVKVIIDEEGKVIFAKPLNGNKLFHRSAQIAALQSTFKSFKVKGKMVKIEGSILYEFGE
ncbi:MAG: hypothetical protein LH614_21225 [Pyrinomonadaceae bacterium]|nr:hypothetical protein [Pyrinomonadaceae bacterium]